jgi:hypothetical protein
VVAGQKARVGQSVVLCFVLAPMARLDRRPPNLSAGIPAAPQLPSHARAARGLRGSEGVAASLGELPAGAAHLDVHRVQPRREAVDGSQVCDGTPLALPRRFAVLESSTPRGFVLITVSAGAEGAGREPWRSSKTDTTLASSAMDKSPSASMSPVLNCCTHARQLLARLSRGPLPGASAPGASGARRAGAVAAVPPRSVCRPPGAGATRRAGSRGGGALRALQGAPMEPRWTSTLRREIRVNGLDGRSLLLITCSSVSMRIGVPADGASAGLVGESGGCITDVSAGGLPGPRSVAGDHVASPPARTSQEPRSVAAALGSVLTVSYHPSR